MIPAGSDDSGETETPPVTGEDEIEVWIGSHNLGNYNGISIDYSNADILAKTTVGSTLRFYYADKTDGAQLQFPGAGTIDVTDNTGYVDIEVTEAVVTELTSNSWPWMSGANMTITKITLRAEQI